MNQKFAIVATISAIVGLLILTKKNRGVGKMTDPEVSIDNLKRGITNGWYQAQLTYVDNKPAVKLSGKLTNGKMFLDVYPISPDVYDELKQMGVKTI